MIFKIHRTCPLLAFGIRGRDCEGNALRYRLADFSMIVYPLGGCRTERLPAIWDEGCGRFTPLVGTRWQNTARRPGRRIQYRAMEIDANGKVVFILDDKVLDGPSGRWRAELYHCNEPIAIAELQVVGGLAVDCVENTTRDGCATVACPPAVCT
jgi:hypothetical protein